MTLSLKQAAFGALILLALLSAGCATTGRATYRPQDAAVATVSGFEAACKYEISGLRQL